VNVRRWLIACALVAGGAGCKEQRDESWGAGQATATSTGKPAAVADAATGDGDAAAAAMALARPPTEAELDAALGRALAMARKLGEISAIHADCGDLAAAIENLIAEHRPLFEELARYGADEATAARTQRWMAAHAGDLDGAIARARPALERCRTDPRIKAAFERLSRWP
jgi:hypothetical protein